MSDQEKYDRVFKVNVKGEAEVEHNPRSDQTKATSSEMVFLTHIISLKTAALIHLGIVPDEDESVDLETAQHMIETLEVLREKTQNNLSHEEERYLDTTIYELRVAFVKINNDQK